MKTLIKIKQVVVVLLCCLFSGCEDYLEIGAPDHKIVSETIFNNDEAAKSTMVGIYNQLFNADFSSGAGASVTVLAGLSADVLTTIRTNNLPYMEFEEHEILANNFRNLNLWSSAYNIIYMTNSLLEGIKNSDGISEDVRDQLKGEAKFVRAFVYFYLVNLYGEVPLVLSTNYRTNSLAVRDTQEEVYLQIIDDLTGAMDLLKENFTTGERTQVNRYTAIALMARVQLYRQNWEEAETLSSQVIAQTGSFEILEDLDQVFLANNREVVWQLSPEGRGSILTNTNEGATFIIHPILSFLAHLKLSDDFVASFEEEDNRLLHWIGYDQRTVSYYPFKYKIRNSTENMSEYSMVLRLAEQYLIRAEALVMQDDLQKAMADLDKIRGRAGLELLVDINPEISKEELLDKIIEERKRELFTEWGHRWLDLKRTGKAGEILGEDNPHWQETDVLYPIPEEERMKNPNLTQNLGY